MQADRNRNLPCTEYVAIPSNPAFSAIPRTCHCHPAARLRDPAQSLICALDPAGPRHRAKPRYDTELLCDIEPWGGACRISLFYR